MKIEEIRCLRGPNVFAHRPILRMTLDLEELAGRESCEFPDFIDRLLQTLPGLLGHRCSRRKEGGFIERLREGTYFGHIVEHVALELSDRAGIPATLGKTLYAGPPAGVYYVAVEYRSEAGSRYLARAAVDLVSDALARRSFPLAETVAEAKRIVSGSDLGPSTRAIKEAAERRGIPCVRLNEGNLLQLGYGKHRRFIQATISDLTRSIAVEIACDKELTKELLARAAVPVPAGRVARSEEEAVDALLELGPPVVVKPLNGNHGQGVSLSLQNQDEVRHAFKIAREFSQDVLVEEMLEGRNYRVLVINGKVVAASERQPASITGDGVHTIAELIERENHDPLRGEGHQSPLTRLELDEVAEAWLARCGCTVHDVPDSGETVLLRESANLSTGGTARDVTDKIHPETSWICERAARAINLDICGIDLVSPDIGLPLDQAGGAIIELNAAPGIRMHHYPSEGAPRDAGGAIVDMLYPPGSTARIPIISITGTNGKTTTARMIAHVLGGIGLIVGLTTTDGIFIGERCIKKGDMAGQRSARTVLSDPTVDVAVLETARGGIFHWGLGYDWSDISVLTNIQPDHIGQDGIESLEDLLHIKSLVAERVRDGGTLVLNADDDQLRRLVELPRVRELQKQLVYFSLDPDNPWLASHRAGNGTCYFRRDGWIIESAGADERRLMPDSHIPATLNGTAWFQTANAMAAIAASRAYGLSVQDIVSSLHSFQSLHNPGRANLYQLNGGYVLVDYGHNPGSFEAVCRMAALWNDRRTTAVIAVPGDRSDSLIARSARVAALGFDRLFIREDRDRRGREPGEIAQLLCRAVQEAVPGRECTIVLDEVEAMTRAIQEMKPSEVIVVFYERRDAIIEVLEKWSAVPASQIDELIPQAIPDDFRPSAVALTT